MDPDQTTPMDCSLMSSLFRVHSVCFHDKSHQVHLNSLLKKNRNYHWGSVQTGKSQPESPTAASFPTGTVDPRVGLFRFPLNTNDGFFSHIPSNFGTVFYFLRESSGGINQLETQEIYPHIRILVSDVG